GKNVLYRNKGNGSFIDATQTASLDTKGTRWGSGCTFVDYDRDGKLDLFVANYLKFDLETAPEPGKGRNSRGKEFLSIWDPKASQPTQICSITTMAMALLQMCP